MAEDVELIRSLGISAYRFSISWARVLPEGHGRPNPKGLDFYKRLVDQLCAAGVVPVAALYHWDLPQKLQDSGGWLNRDIIEHFREYACLMFDTVGDRVHMWNTHNEPRVMAFLGYGSALMAPGIADTSAAYQAAHHLLLAHGKAVQAFHQSGKQGEIGIIIDSEDSTPASDSGADREAAQRYYEQDTGFFADALFKGKYPEKLMTWIGPMAPSVQNGDLEVISTPVDFLGVNYYRSAKVAFDQDGGYLKCRATAHTLPMWGFTEVGWGVYPAGLKAVLLNLRNRYGNLKLYVSENGCATQDVVKANGVVDDIERIDFLRRHLLAAQASIEAGVNLKGYFVWSLLDNFEWSQGYQPRFGLVHVDYSSLKRTPKRSYNWYREVVQNNGVPE
jgi:beta-glucosidase